MNRRSFLTSVTTGGALGITVCLGRLDEGDEVRLAALRGGSRPFG